MLIQLPNETWMEILNWLRRRDLIEKLDQLWDRQFTPIVQGWLHVYTRNVKMGTLAAKANSLHFRLDYDDEKEISIEKEVPIAQVEMPENITSFEEITISSPHLDTAILLFLHRMRPLFRNICLNFHMITLDEHKLPIPIQYQDTVRLLMPLISDDQIESLIADRQWLQFLADNYPTFIFNAKRLCIWNVKPSISELLINWLFTRREDGQPRTLEFFYNPHLGEFCTKIRERFLDPARQPFPCPFFIHICMFNIDTPLATPPVTENVATGEQLTSFQGVVDDGEFHWLMTNCPSNVDPEWLAKKTAEMHELGKHKLPRIFSIDLPSIEPKGPFSRMMSTLKRMISNWWMTMFG